MAAQSPSECDCASRYPSTIDVQDADDTLITLVRIETVDAACRRCGRKYTLRLIPAGRGLAKEDP